MLKGHELAFGNHSEFPVRQSRVLYELCTGMTTKALLWSYLGGGFDPHPGYIDLSSNLNPSDEGLIKLRSVLASVLSNSKIRSGDLIDGFTVCFAPLHAGPRCAILILEGDAGMVTSEGMTDILADLDSELEET